MAVISLICVAALTPGAIAQNAPAESRIDLEHTKWIDSALRSMQGIKLGSTQAELLTVFTTEGGLSTPSQRTYVYRHCP
jgi:hypothetical protein